MEAVRERKRTRWFSQVRNMRNFHADWTPKHGRARDQTEKMSFLTCSRPDPSSKMGSSAVAVSSSVCIFPLATPSYLRTPVASEGRDLPGGAGSVTPSAASPCSISRWRGLRQRGIIYFERRYPPLLLLPRSRTVPPS